MSKIQLAIVFLFLSASLCGQFDGINLALNKPVTASSEIQPATNAVDGNYTTRWESSYSDNQWISIDLESRYVIDTIIISWEAIVTSANPGIIQGSYDGNYWWDIAELSATDADKVDTLVVNVTTRFVKLKGIHRNGPYGYSPYEIEVYGYDKITTPYIDSLSVAPKTSNLNYGETLQFVFESFDHDKNPIAPATAQWMVSNGGKISSDGLFSANKVGEFTIMAVSDKVSDTAWVKVTSEVPVPTSVYITPEIDTLQEGEPLYFTAKVFDQDSVEISGDITWSSQFNTIDNSGLFYGHFTGNNQVYATLNYSYGSVTGNISDTAVVAVYPKSTQNVCFPNIFVKASSEIQDADNAVDNNIDTRWEPVADATDIYWEIKLTRAYDIGAVLIDWEVAGGQSYDIQLSNNGTLWTTIYQFNPENKPRTLENHQIDYLPVNGKGQYVKFVGKTRTFPPYGPSFWEFKVIPAINSILGASKFEISPKTVTISEGEKLQLEYTSFDIHNHPKAVSANWSVVGSGATISSSGLFTSQNAGVYPVVISSGTITDTAFITVEDASVLDSIDITPKDAVVSLSETQQFTAKGFDQFGIEYSITPEWSVSGGGSIDASGLFTSSEPGNYTVTAMQGDISATVPVIVEFENTTKNISANSIKLFPLPVKDKLSVAIDNEQFNRIEIFDINGTMVLSRIISDASIILNIDVTDLAPGIYFIRCLGYRKVHSLRMVKQ